MGKHLGVKRFNELDEKDIFYIQMVHGDNDLPWDQRMSILIRKFGVSERSIRRWIKKLGFSSHQDISNQEIRQGKVREYDNDKQYYIITWAQNATPVHSNFWNNILTYADYLNANVGVIQGRYQNPTSLWTSKMQTDDWWDECFTVYERDDQGDIVWVDKDGETVTKEEIGEYVAKRLKGKEFEDGRVNKKIKFSYLDAGRHNIHSYLDILSDVKVRPTAVNPLVGFEGISGDRSSILGHPRVHLRSLPVLKGHPNKLLLTTGACTIKNYTDTKSGKKAEFHHTYGFVIVEIKDDLTFYIRQVTADQNGNFIDLVNEVTDQEVSKVNSCDVFVLGDIHTANVHEPTMHSTINLFNVICPKNIILHDIFDGESVNHHEAKDPIKAYERYKGGKDLVKSEVEGVKRLIDEYDLINYNPIVIRSNHDCFHKDTEFLTETGWKTFEDIRDEDLLAQFDKSFKITFEKPLGRIAKKASKLIEIESDYHYQVVTPNHDIIFDGVKIKAKDLSSNNDKLLPSFGVTNSDGVLEDYDQNIIRLISWVVSDGTIVYNKLKSGDRSLERIQFKLSKVDKIFRLRKILEDLSIKYTFREAKKSLLNKLQPYYITIYSDDCRLICSYFEGDPKDKIIPKWFLKMSKDEIRAYFEELLYSDGYEDKWGKSSVVSINKDYLDILQSMAVLAGIPSVLRKGGKSGFENGKDQYILTYRLDELIGGNSNPHGIKVNTLDYNDTVYCFEMSEGTLITRFNGKVALSGNCWLEKWIKERDWKKDIANAEEYMEYSLVLLRGEAPKGLVPYILDKHYGDGITTLDLDDSYKINGWELGHHGHLGSHGSKGNLEQFRKLNTKVIVADYHQPGRKDGAVGVGTYSELRLGYNKGASAWMHSGAILHTNGKVQQIIFMDDDHFTTFSEFN